MNNQESNLILFGSSSLAVNSVFACLHSRNWNTELENIVHLPPQIASNDQKSSSHITTKMSRNIFFFFVFQLSSETAP